MISAYIPCFNNADTLGKAIDSLQHQSLPPAEILVLDDGSSDDSVAVAEQRGLRVIRHEVNRGRGAVRARAMNEARHEFVLCCDAAAALTANFNATAQAWFTDARVAAVCGRITQPPARTLAERWRGRHLFRLHLPAEVCHGASLTTGGAMVRATAIRAVGNYNPSLTHTEDSELGRRLLAAGYDVIYDPRIEVVSLASNSLGQVLERYWRWNAGAAETVNTKHYFKQMVYAAKVMAVQDLRAHDLLCAAVSLCSPHYQYWRSLHRKRQQRRFAKSL